MKSRKGGFTLVELLAVITILGILTGIVLFQASNTVKKADYAYYKTQEKMILLAAKDYFLDYRSQLPKLVNETKTVSLKVLVEGLYIEEVLDVKKQSCDLEKSKVEVTLQNEKDYDYHIYLKCPLANYETHDAS